MLPVTVLELVKELSVVLPDIQEFCRLGDLTTLHQTSDGGFKRSRYDRGILLYALVAHYRPRTVLEFGTGRGFGCLCMAMAMEDQGIPGKIYTVDLMPPDQRFPWALDWQEGAGPQIENLSRNEV